MPPRSDLSHVHADPPLFLRESATVDLASALRACSGDVTFSRHGLGKAEILEPTEKTVKPVFAGWPGRRRP